MKKIGILSIFICALLACETEVTDFKVSSTSTSLVVYGEINNSSEPYVVRINQVAKYDPYNVNSFIGSPEENAKVSIVDKNGTTTTLSELRPGFYQAPFNFRGIVSHEYQLKISTQSGLEIESEFEELKSPPVLSNFSAKFIDAEKVEDMRYDLDAKIKDTPNSEDFYFVRRQDFIQFLTTCEDPPPPPAPPPPCYVKCWRAPLNTQPQLIKDFLIDGAEIPIKLTPANLEEITDWIVQLDVLSVSKSTYTFWERQEEQRTVGGSIFDKIPAQIVGNLKCTNDPSKQVLGVFAVAGVNKQRLKLDRLFSLSTNVTQKIQTFIDFNDIRFTRLKLNNCSQAGFIDYNLGFEIPPLQN